MKTLTVLLLAAGCLAATGSAATAGTEHSKPIVVTFQKHLVDADNLVFQGTAGGRAKGALESRMVPGSLTIAGSVWHFAFDWIVDARSPHKSFVARTEGTFDLTTGRVAMEGTVTDGWHDGAAVHEEGQLLDPDTFTFAGELQIARDGEH